MQVLLSTIGTRGDVQPLVALALQLKTLGHDVRVCVPPDFQAWIESLEVTVLPIGPSLRATAKVSPTAPPPTLKKRRQLVEASVISQFETLARAARGCDLIVGATALQIAAPSVAEALRIPYVFAAYCPAVLPSPHHAPPVLGRLGDSAGAASAEYETLWAQEGARFHALFGAALNAHRSRLGLAEVEDARAHVFTRRPWLAVDPTLGPWPDGDDRTVLQTGAWLLRDARPLEPVLEAFLAAGAPPVYLGFGSIRAPESLSVAAIQAARALGRRVIVARGWAELSPLDDGADCIAIGEVNQQALFPHVAAVIHHGGAGTTTAAARAGTPQVVLPQIYDQHYWAERVQDLGIGAAHPALAPTAASLASALGQALRPEIAARARAVAGRVRDDGTRVAAQALQELAGTRSCSPT